jgi:uncharacterized integral membrane protein
MPAVYLLITAVALAIAVFALQNAQPVTLRFLWWRLEGAPLALVILVSGAAGAFVASAIGFLRHWKLRAEIRQVKSQGKAPEPPKRAA